MATTLPTPILPIIRMGHPTLRQVAQLVDLPASDAVRDLAQHMVATMIDAPGVGLAAPQVDVPLRLIVYRVPATRLEAGEPTEPMGPQVLINPVLTPLSEEQHHGVEGCLSIPGLKGEVPRYKHIRYEGFDLDGQRVGGEAHDFHARVLQHEVDHLDGVLYLDRMDDLSSLGYLDVMMEMAQAAEEDDDHGEDKD